MNASAILSPCRQYRYQLWRRWDDTKPVCVFIGLNPSTADETKDDPTIRKCVGYARRWGYGSLCMLNLFAFRATLPANMKKAELPVGIDNHHHVLKVCSGAALVVAAWGNDGKFQNQDLNVRQWLHSIGVELYCLKQNADGTPAHPLYLRNDATPYPMNGVKKKLEDWM